MGDKDISTKNFMSTNTVFADAFNFFLYNGEQVIKSKTLKPLDTTAIGILSNSGNGIQASVQKVRDVLKVIAAMQDENNAYLILGVENESNQLNTMPVRNMIYDSLEYGRQIKEIAEKHKEDKYPKKISGDEFLSGFHKDDKLIPVITLVIYWGADPWLAPRSIRDMLDIKDEKLLPFINDYHINILVPAEISDDDDKFHTDLGEVLFYIKNSKDKKKLIDLVNNNKNYSKLTKEAAYVINACTNSNLKINNNEEVVDMCKAIEDMREESELKGKMEGKAEAKTKIVINLYKKGFSLDDIIEIAEMTEDEVNNIITSNK